MFDINKYLKDKRIRQAILLLSVNIINIPVGIVTNIIITKFLGPEEYGDYQFLINIFNFAIIIFTFGFLNAGNRAIVLNNDEKKTREYYGAELVILLFAYLIMSLSLLLYSFFDNNLQEKGLELIFYYLIPFGWVFLIVRFYEVLLQADNKISLLAKTRFLPKFGFLLFAIGLYLGIIESATNKLEIVLIFYLGFQIIVFIYILFRLRITFINLKLRIKEIYKFNKSYGFDVYIGSLFSLGFYELTGVLISYFSLDNTGVGFYSLALTFAMPLSVIPNTIATTQYKEFSVSNKISKKLFLTTLGITVLALAFLWIIIKPFILRFYDPAFEEVISLTYIVSIGVLAHGLADFFNRFLGANGKGKALKYSSLIVGLSLFASSLILIPIFKEKGAAIARLISGLIYLIVIVIFYFKFISKTQLQSVYNKSNNIGIDNIKSLEE
jgi:O-antigen/teichoic acid export membrane protein